MTEVKAPINMGTFMTHGDSSPRTLPADNVMSGLGFYIQWQNGPSSAYNGVNNGATPKDVLTATANWLEALDTAYGVDSNAEAIELIRKASTMIWASY